MYQFSGQKEEEKNNLCKLGKSSNLHTIFIQTINTNVIQTTAVKSLSTIKIVLPPAANIGAVGILWKKTTFA